MKKEYKKLELDKVLQMLAEQAWSEECAENCQKITPLHTLSEIELELKHTDDAFVLSSKFGTPRFYKVKNMSSSAKRAEQGAVLSLRELLDCSLLLREIDGLCSWYSQCSSIETSLSEFFSQLTPNKRLGEAISNAIVSEEELSDDASPELSRIRKAIVRQGSKIKENNQKSGNEQISSGRNRDTA